MEAPKITPDTIVAYFNFLFDFLKSPRVCVQGYLETSGEDSKPTILGRFAWYAIVSVAVATGIVKIGDAIGMAPDGSSSIEIINKLGVITLPLAALITIILGSAFGHVLVKITGLFARLAGHDLFDGDVKNSINAALAYSALIIPFFTLAIVFLRIISAQGVETNPILIIAIILPIDVVAFFYLIAAFSGAHRIPWRQAIYLFGATVTLIVIFAKLLTPDN